MGIARLRDPGPIDACGAGVLSRRQSQECRVSVSLGESFEVTGFHNQRQCSVSLDAKETSQLFDTRLIPLFRSNLFDPLVKAFNLCFLLIVGSEIFIHRLAVH